LGELQQCVFDPASFAASDDLEVDWRAGAQAVATECFAEAATLRWIYP
jgi:hypothetical protein